MCRDLEIPPTGEPNAPSLLCLDLGLLDAILALGKRSNIKRTKRREGINWGASLSQFALSGDQICLAAAHTVSTLPHQEDSDKLVDKFQPDNARGCGEVDGPELLAF